KTTPATTDKYFSRTGSPIAGPGDRDRQPASQPARRNVSPYDRMLGETAKCWWNPHPAAPPECPAAASDGCGSHQHPAAQWHPAGDSLFPSLRNRGYSDRPASLIVSIPPRG